MNGNEKRIRLAVGAALGGLVMACGSSSSTSDAPTGPGLGMSAPPPAGAAPGVSDGKPNAAAPAVGTGGEEALPGGLPIQPSSVEGAAVAGASGEPSAQDAGASRDAGSVTPPPPPVILGGTPPMGWNSWNTFGCNVSEVLIKSMADAIVSRGMQAAGYQYVNIDDCWMDGRDANGKLRWSANFPAGMPALADYIHGLGLKIGIYEVPADRTCANTYGGYAPGAGSLGHEVDDANTFAEWGIDYLKYDLCVGQRSGFAVMRDALRATGRPILYSINPGNGQNDLCPPDRCALDLPSIANIWRIGFDINTQWTSWLRLIDENANLFPYAGPGHFNDPDMLEVGRGATADEDRSHFSMWAIMAAPLLAGNDLRNMSNATQTILTNAEVIAIDQDPLGVQGRLVATPAPDLQVWSKPLSGTNSRAVVLFNRSGAAAAMTAQWAALGLPAGQAQVRDLWSHTDLGSFADSYTAASVPSHGVVMLKVASIAQGP
jgi:alpha-galactosidase